MTSSEGRPGAGADAGERDRRRAWRIWFAVHALSLLAAAGAVAAHQVVIDPFAVWGTRPIKGLSNFKSSEKVGRLSKPYQYARIRPDVVFLGNSRVAMGMPDRWPGTSGDRVYNFGLDDLGTEEAAEVVDFMIRAHKPKILVFGIDLLFFNKRILPFPVDYSRERMEWAALSGLTRVPWQLRETVFSMDAVERARATVVESEKHPKNVIFSPGGYRQAIGGRKRSNPRQYKIYAWNYLMGRYGKYKIRDESLLDFDRIVDRAREAGIDLRVFWVPKNADMLAVIDVSGRMPMMERIKRHVAEKVPFWDFGTVSSVTARRSNYYDMSHFLGSVGELVARRVSGAMPGGPDDFGELVTAQSVERHLQDAQRRLKDFEAENRKLTDLLIKARRKKLGKKAFLEQIGVPLGFEKGKARERPTARKPGKTGRRP